MINGNHSATWVMGLAAALLTTMLGGSFLYTWSNEAANTEEKRDWRNQHERIHSQALEQVQINQKRLEEKSDKRYDETRQVLQEILIETLAAKKAAERRGLERRTP